MAMSTSSASASAVGGPLPRCEYGLRTPTAHREPIARRQGYTEPRLSLRQYGELVGVSSFACACLSRPIAKLEYFYFLSDIPGESNRIFLSDKRAQFFRVLFNTSWWSGRTPLLFSTADNIASLGLFLAFRAGLASALSTAEKPQRAASGVASSTLGGLSPQTQPWSVTAPIEHIALSLGEPHRVLCGFLAGALAGVGSCALRHPYDVLRATADMQGGSRRFRGPWDVLWTALRERPAILTGIYRGFTTAASGRSLRYGAQFGLYDGLRYDGAYRGTAFLFLYCHLATVCGMALEYPILSLKQQLKHLNAMSGGAKPLTYRALFDEMRRRHGVSKIWDGFFQTRPFLNAVAPALLLTAFDIGSRRWTERMQSDVHPTQAVPAQSLTTITLPPYAASGVPDYEFEHRTKRSERLRGSA